MTKTFFELVTQNFFVLLKLLAFHIAQQFSSLHEFILPENI